MDLKGRPDEDEDDLSAERMSCSFLLLEWRREDQYSGNIAAQPVTMIINLLFYCWRLNVRLSCDVRPLVCSLRSTEGRRRVKGRSRETRTADVVFILELWCGNIFWFGVREESRLTPMSQTKYKKKTKSEPPCKDGLFSNFRIKSLFKRENLHYYSNNDTSMEGGEDIVYCSSVWDDVTDVVVTGRLLQGDMKVSCCLTSSGSI